MPFEYRMVQIPPNISVRGVEQGQEAANFLENVVNEQARQGWDFYRIDTIGVESRPGCTGILLRLLTGGFLRGQLTYTNYYVASFRRESQGSP